MADTIQVVIESLKGVDERLQALQNAVNDFQKVLGDRDKLPEAAKNFSSQVRDTVGTLDKMIREDIALLQQAPPPGNGGGSTQPVDTANLADHFRSIVDTIQLQAQQPQVGQVATTLKSLDVELKTLIVVQDNKTRLITPSPTQTFDPAQLSTIRMSFNSVPVVQQPPGATPPTPGRVTTPAVSPVGQPPTSRTGVVEGKPTEASSPPAPGTGKRSKAAEKSSTQGRSRRKPPGEPKK